MYECKTNAITKAFGFKLQTVSEYIPPLKSDDKELIMRKKRQLVALATVAAISFISIFSTSQLMSMAKSSDDDLITIKNHIITALED